jgi:transcriptional regulator GlxA family with amidase domain
VKKILVYMPQRVVGMSAMLIKELIWVAAHNDMQHRGIDANPSDYVQLVSADGRSVRCFSGNEISVDVSLESAQQADAIFLCAFWGAPQHILTENQALIDWLPQAHRAAIPIAGSSNGPYFMAEAGLLDDKVATIYPPTAKDFEQRYPAVNLRPERAITDAGDLYCANGIASGCDLIVSMIELLYGPNIARLISHDYLLGFNRSYTLANMSFDGQKYHRDRQILTAQRWLERNFSNDVKLEVVAADIGMSPRNFSRRFKQATGDTPSLYLQRVRMEAARDLLRNTALSVAEVAYRVGYADLSYFSKVFKRYEGCLPHVFREEVEH